MAVPSFGALSIRTRQKKRNLSAPVHELRVEISDSDTVNIETFPVVILVVKPFLSDVLEYLALVELVSTRGPKQPQ